MLVAVFENQEKGERIGFGYLISLVSCFVPNGKNFGVVVYSLPTFDPYGIGCSMGF